VINFKIIQLLQLKSNYFTALKLKYASEELFSEQDSINVPKINSNTQTLKETAASPYMALMASADCTTA